MGARSNARCDAETCEPNFKRDTSGAPLEGAPWRRAGDQPSGLSEGLEAKRLRAMSSSPQASDIKLLSLGRFLF
jgi:hypothetical protein